MIQPEDEAWMREAIAIARSKGSDPSTSPLGCVIVLDGRMIAGERNQTQELPDATAHAEMMAIRRGCENSGDMELRGATLYSTLQPCGMCTMASIWAKVGRVVYGAGRHDVHQMYFEARHIDTLDFVAEAYRDDISIEGGCLRAECAELYYPPDAELSEEEQANL
ncbi:nucleoside deaminase [Sphingobium yanoikuyae]|uniref:Nucleoside deaminase n=1 Tax=Sphingobium yanoikuyae TaxID=13690 RepID=A0A085K486_SPHYA|nr:nucleoside deaminase [Sphingobium yanoikuyae]AYO79003.1 nucleoside deaminase [Sphingobium yanoikuyae]KFD27532.1 cytosine deaminase [Sphingobium yanoikuyae]MDH2132720.1 nucleoside deaminase [Sphingobium yanoikuyae]MDH2149408.1 nucleoside deaminase [Sphingobium yanoikuyae]MDH2168133.1 nucleoside deaminase [Sphingobium yanoikuyae]